MDLRSLINMIEGRKFLLQMLSKDELEYTRVEDCSPHYFTTWSSQANRSYNLVELGKNDPG